VARDSLVANKISSRSCKENLLPAVKQDCIRSWNTYDWCLVDIVSPPLHISLWKFLTLNARSSYRAWKRFFGNLDTFPTSGLKTTPSKPRSNYPCAWEVSLTSSQVPEERKCEFRLSPALRNSQIQFVSNFAIIIPALVRARARAITTDGDSVAAKGSLIIAINYFSLQVLARPLTERNFTGPPPAL